MIVTTSAVKGNSVLQQAAQDYAHRGWHIVPIHTIKNGRCSCGKECSSPGKHPRTGAGLHEATTSSSIIGKWWKNSPDSNIAVRTGKVSGFWVLDADGAEGINAVQDLERLNGDLPQTVTVQTGRGGRHYYFQMPADQEISNATKLGGQPVDVRGDGGYVLVPPSNHITGKYYAWEISPEEADIAQAPAWLLNLVTKRNSWPEVRRDAPMQPLVAATVAGGQAAPLPVPIMPSAERRVLRIKEELDSASGAAQGNRHDQALKLVGAALVKGKPLAEVEAEALEWGAKCNPPMEVGEIKRIVSDLGKKHQAAISTSWEPPLPFHEFELPAFPTDALPSWLQAFVDAEAEATQTPPDMVGMLALATVAAAAAKKVEVAVKDGYTEPINIFTVTALPPANRKSAVFGDVTAPLREFEDGESKRLTPEIAEAKAKLRITEAALEKTQRQAATADGSDKAVLTQEAVALAKEIAETVTPTAPRLVAADTTPERLATLLQENHGRIAVMSPEGDVFDLMAGRYGNKGTPNFGVYLNGHAGDDLRVDRVGRQGEFVTKPALTLGLVVQPDVIHGLADKPGFRGRGLLGRFLYCLPKSLVGRRDTDPPTVPNGVREDFRGKLLALVKLPFDKDQNGVERPYFLQLSPEAKQLYLNFAKQVEPMLADFGQLGTISDWGGKLVGAVVRIAGILHMAEHAGEQLPWASPITATTMQQAIRIGKYLVPHAKAAFAQMAADPVLEDAKFVWRWIERKAVTNFTEREVFEGTKGHFRKVNNLRPALGVLVEHGFLRQRAQQEKTGPGRRPSPTYDVNPLACSHNPHASQSSELLFDFANSVHSANGVLSSPPPLVLGSANSAKNANGVACQVAPPASVLAETKVPVYQEGVL